MSELAPVDLATAKAGHACRQCGSPVSHTFVDLGMSLGDWGAKFIVPIPIPVIVEPGETR